MKPWILLPVAIATGCGGVSYPHPPVGFGAAEQVARGRILFLEHCAICHGKEADGRGQRHASLSSEPPDFNLPEWQDRRSAGHVFTIVHDGKRGTSMPAWVGKLPEAQIWAIAAYIKSLDKGSS